MKRIRKYAPYIIVLFSVLGTHGLLLLNDGVYWDDWLWVTALKEKNWSTIYAISFERGIPLDAYFLWFFSGYHNIEFAHRFVAFLSILLATVLVYAICREVGVLTRDESLWIAVISQAYPAFQTQILLSTTQNLFYYMLFLGGVFLALKSQNSASLLRHGLRWGALILFFLGFSLASLLVFYFGFLLLLALFVRWLNALSVKETLTGFLPHNLDYILLPFLFWIVKGIFFPRYGSYANYNEFTFSPTILITSLVSFVENGIFGQINAALRELFTPKPLAVIGVLSFLWMVRDFRITSFRQSTKPYALLAFGFLLLSLGMFPYVAVGLSPTMTGWLTRHNLLLALPVALIIVAVARILFSTTQAGFSIPGKIFLTTLLLAFGLAMVSTYIDWQARSVKDHSLIINLSRLKGAENYSVYWIDDQYPLGGEARYDVYEWAGMFKQVWGGETRIGFQADPSTSKLLTDYKPDKVYSIVLNGFDPASCQAILMIRKGTSTHTHTETGLVERYFYYRFLRPQNMQDFLDGVTRVEFQAFPSPLAVHCRQQ